MHRASIKKLNSTEKKGAKKAFITDVSYIKNPNAYKTKNNQNSKKSQTKNRLKKLRSQEIKERNHKTRLPKISSSIKQKKQRNRQKENINKDLKSFVGSFNREFKIKRDEARDPKFGNSQNKLLNKHTKIECVEKFLSNQETKTRKNVKSVYRRLAKNAEPDVLQLLTKMESKSSFKQLLKMKEEELILTKKKFNQMNFKLKRAKETLKGIDKRIQKEELDLVDRTNEGQINQAIQNDKDLNDNLEEVRLITESLVHKKKMYSADILILKKNTETLKTLLRRWKKIRSDLERKKNTNIKLSNHLLEKIISEKKKRDDVSEVFGNSKNLKNLFHNELELFRDKIILEEMIKKKDNDGNNQKILIKRFSGEAKTRAVTKRITRAENEG
jgi:hypothetical protein